MSRLDHSDHYTRGMEALRAAAQTVEELNQEICRLEARISLASAPQEIADLASITGMTPHLHLGHLTPEKFEKVRERLGIAPADVIFSPHSDGSAYFTLRIVRNGVEIRAQRNAHAPPAEIITYSGAA